MKSDLGGDRLGSGNKQEIAMKNYERSSHDLGYIWRSSMAAGTLVPFMSEVALPGDSFDIDLECDVKTLPTNGPLFGSYKVQLDVFQCPIRLYQGKLHMNMLNIGMDMSEIYLPQMRLQANYKQGDGDRQQIGSSSIYSYFNINGLGRNKNIGEEGKVRRDFNAVPLLSYWDIYKNYYANKQEERGFVVHNSTLTNDFVINKAVWLKIGPTIAETNIYNNASVVAFGLDAYPQLRVIIGWNQETLPYGFPEPSDVILTITDGTTETEYSITSVFQDVEVVGIDGGMAIEGNGEFQILCNNYIGDRSIQNLFWEVKYQTVNNTKPTGIGAPQLKQFKLDNIDEMRMNILKSVGDTTPFILDGASLAPYGLGLRRTPEGDTCFATGNQEGLGIKTYQSDLFNNWISTEWIDGDNGINAITSVSVPLNRTGTEGAFTIDSLNLANKVYNMLNRIAISGGSYDDWLDAVYTHDRAKSCESPIYHGSLIKELAFEEVINQSASEVGGVEQELGTLAGRGRLTNKNKGGKMKIKIDEPSYLIGIASITPRVDYSQGNKWDMSLETMNDFHKPALDEIGFQDLVTDQMAWFDTYLIQPTGHNVGQPNYFSAGKQPAWINYMTNVNVTKGKFADDSEMFMTLNRRYEDDGLNGKIGDLTTYVDPSKFNYIFAQTSLDSMNFWVQIKNDIFARRKMSAKVIPNL